MVKGIDARLESGVTDIGHAVTDGSLDGLTPATEDELAGIVLGKDLANHIGAKVGDTVRLMTPNGTLSPMGVMPRQRRLKVVGLFRMGLYEVDAGWGFVDLNTGMTLAGTDLDHIEAKVANVYDAPRIADQIAEQFGRGCDAGLGLRSPAALLGAAPELGMGIGIGLIVAVAALNIVASLILLRT